MALNRKILPKEEKLLELLVEKSSMNFPSNWKENLLVCTMQDGEMGSLQLFPHGSAKENRLFGKRISEYPAGRDVRTKKLLRICNPRLTNGGYVILINT